MLKSSGRLVFHRSAKGFVDRTQYLLKIHSLDIVTYARSLQGTIDTVNLVKVVGKPIAIIINNFTSATKFKHAKDYLIDTLGQLPIFGIRTTTLFERVAKDGSEWYSKVHQVNGEYQLNKTRIAHEKVYEAIIALGAKK